MDVVLAIDQGTSGTKVLAIDAELAVLASAAAPLRCAYPRPGWAELDAEAIWSSVTDAVQGCLAQLQGPRVLGVGLANQRESALCWRRSTGEVIGPCVTWQCRRGAPTCEQVAATLGADRVRALSGLPLDAAYSAAKMRWLIDHAAGDTSDLALGTVDSFLAFRLTGGARHVIEIGNAARTQLVDLAGACWSRELLDAFGLAPELLPQLIASAEAVGPCAGLPVLSGAMLAGICGDSHGSLFSHFAGDGDALKATYGTGSSVVTTADGLCSPEQLGPLSQSILWKLEGLQLGVEGNVLAAAAALDWTATLLGCESIAEFEALACSAEASRGVSFVPALAGLGAPWLEARAQGRIEGLRLDVGRGELAYAAYEAVAHQVVDVVERIEQGGYRRGRLLYVDGGASRSDLLLQLQADLLGAPVARGMAVDGSALGAAFMAGVALKLWTLEELHSRIRIHQLIEPRLSDDERAARRASWRSAVRSCVEAASSRAQPMPDGQGS